MTHRAGLQLPGPHGRRADQPRRAGLRPLLAAAQGAHHLPGHADRRHDRQPGLRPAAAPRVGEPRQGHQPLHQLARRRHHGAVRHLRHDAVHQARHHHHLLRPGRLGRRGAAGGGHQGQAPRPAARPDPAAPAVGPGRPARPPTSRSRPRRSCACATSSNGILAEHTGQPTEKLAGTPTATSSLSADEAKEYGIIDEVISARELRRQLAVPITRGQLTDTAGGDDVAKFGDGGELLKCSFCGKSQKQVKKLIAGPGRLHLRRVHRPLQRDHRGGALRDPELQLRRAAQAP